MNLSYALSRYARPKRPRSPDACELCSAPFGARHRHVMHLDQRTLSCVCPPCALLFTNPAAGNGTYRTVPERVLVDPSFVLDDTTWSSLDIPVRLAFVFFNSRRQRWVALYPSPAGPMESELALQAWSMLAKTHALVGAIEPDVEALLAYGRHGQVALDAYLVPIDACYELVGLVRRHWKGLDGGEARPHIEKFFDGLRARSSVLRPSRRSGVPASGGGA